MPLYCKLEFARLSFREKFAALRLLEGYVVITSVSQDVRTFGIQNNEKLACIYLVCNERSTNSFKHITSGTLVPRHQALHAFEKPTDRVMVLFIRRFSYQPRRKFASSLPRMRQFCLLVRTRLQKEIQKVGKREEDKSFGVSNRWDLAWAPLIAMHRLCPQAR